MPFGFRRGSGRKKGAGRGVGRGAGRRGGGRKFGAGRPENCICPSCSTILPHQPGFPCFEMSCPRCRTPMTRQFIMPDSTNKIGQKAVPVIDINLCTGCGKCVLACSVDAITVVEDKAVINDDRCNGCGACIAVCPAAAIK